MPLILPVDGEDQGLSAISAMDCLDYPFVLAPGFAGPCQRFGNQI